VKKRLAEKGLKKSGKMPRVYEQINEKSQIPLGKIISGNRWSDLSAFGDFTG